MAIVDNAEARVMFPAIAGAEAGLPGEGAIAATCDAPILVSDNGRAWTVDIPTLLEENRGFETTVIDLFSHMARGPLDDGGGVMYDTLPELRPVLKEIGAVLYGMWEENGEEWPE